MTGAIADVIEKKLLLKNAASIFEAGGCSFRTQTSTKPKKESLFWLICLEWTNNQ